MNRIEKRRNFIKEWLKDLRSGEFKQGKNELCDNNNNYCCLGVACITGQRLGIKEASFSTGQQYRSSKIPGAWLKEIIGSCNPKVNYRDELMSLSTVNDFTNKSFKEIADIIERDLLR